MRYYQHHIGDFNNATRHLSRIERSIYRDLIELYYDIEHQLPDDIAWICRRIVANDCSTDVERMLSEFFTKTPDGWYHDRCEHEIDKFNANNSQRARAGKASAAKRAEKRQQAMNGRSTHVEQALNESPTEKRNHKPLTINHNKTLAVAEAPALPAVKKTSVGFDYQKAIWTGLAENPDLLKTWADAYPAVDMRSEFQKMRAWLTSNPRNRKTNLTKFVNNWLSKAQDRAAGTGHKTFAEREQDYKDQKAKEFYQPLFDMTEEEMIAWGFKEKEPASE